MGDTTELTLQELHESLEKVRLEGERHQQLGKIAAAMIEQGFDPEGVGGAGLEGALVLLGFERGFLFAFEGEDLATDDVPADVSGLKALASRALCTGTDGARWASVLNPEFAVNRSVVTRALASTQLIVLNDCLLEPMPQGEAQHRTVLCEVFGLGPDSRGVLYLDRGMGKKDVSEDELRLVREFSHWCLPIVGRAYVARAMGSTPGAGVLIFGCRRRRCHGSGPSR